MIDLTISIVLYNTDETELANIINLLNESTLTKRIFLIDNSSNDNLKKNSAYQNTEYIFNGENIGYGAGHNIAIKQVHLKSKYHLILNADVNFDPIILKSAFEFMELNNNEVVMLSPQILWPDGKLQYFSRMLPTPFDLFSRRFIPEFLKPLFKKRMDDYILFNHDYTKSMNVPNLPGCFMFIKTDILNSIGGFDENFFMYVEDIDLTRRLYEKGKTLYYPKIVIEHGLAQGSYKISKLLIYHIKSAIYYFNKWGWFNDKTRDIVNESLKHEQYI